MKIIRQAFIIYVIIISTCAIIYTVEKCDESENIEHIEQLYSNTGQIDEVYDPQ